MRLTDELRKALRVRVDYTNMTDKYLGDKGISQKTLDAHKKLAKAAHAFVANNRGRDELFMGWTELPYNQDEIVADILEEAKKIRRNFENFVVLGIGGSALGPIMAFNALCHLHYNDLPKSKAHEGAFGRHRRQEDVLQRHLQVGRDERDDDAVPHHCRPA